jgi:Tfp pilus assembly protein PilF
MSLLMKALKQAERDHDEAINTVVDLGDSADSIDSGSLDSALRASASEEPAGNEIGFALDDHTDELPKTAHTVDPMSGQSDDAAIDRLDLTGTDFEEFDPDQIDDAIEQHSGVQPDLSRHIPQDEASGFVETAAIDGATKQTEPGSIVSEQPVEIGMPDEANDPDDLGLDLNNSDPVDDEQTLIDSSNEGAFIGTAKLATVKKQPGVLRKVIAGLSLAVLAIVGAGWYALELLHIPAPANEPVLAATSVRTVQSASSSLNEPLASTDFQSTASVGAVTELESNPVSDKREATSASDPAGANVSTANATAAKQAAVKQPVATQAPKTNDQSAPTRGLAPTLSSAKNDQQRDSKSNQSVPAALNPGPKPAIQFRKVSNAREQQSQLLNNAYAALRTNDNEKAAVLYQQALANDRLSVDVWVGLATLAVREGNVTKARQAYENALRINPNDSVAIAGKLSLQGEGDALSQESRYRTLLAANPNNAALQFELASTLAAQDRWVEAQKAYFNAASAAPSHPDYAFNLAVSLEHIRQPGIALQYYSRALELASSQRPEFDRAMAEQRIKALRSDLGRN